MHASSESRPAVFGFSRHLTAGQAPENRKYDITALTFRNVGMSGCLFTPLERNRGSGVDAADQLLFFFFFPKPVRLNSHINVGPRERIKTLKQLQNEASPVTRAARGALFPLSCSEAASAENHLTHFLEFISPSLITGGPRTHPGLMSCTSARPLISWPLQPLANFKVKNTFFRLY